MRKMKGVLLAVAIFCMTTVVTYAKPMELVYDGKTHQYNLPPITLYINDAKIETPIIPPIQLDNRVLVPIREVFEPMGAKIEWKNLEKKVYIDYKDTLLILETNNKKAWMDGETIELDVPAKVVNNKIMVPVRFISERMGFAVDWSDTNRTVKISEPKKPSIPETGNNTENNNNSGNENNSNNNSNENNSNNNNNNSNSNENNNSTPNIPQYEGQNNLFVGNANPNPVAISAQNLAKTNIKSASVGDNIGATFAAIEATSPISSANIMVLEGKVIVDIKNSISQLNSTITPSYNNYVKNIRTSQFTPDTTRVVFDLKTGASIKASVSENRKSIMIDLMPQQIETVATGNDSKGEYLAIGGIGSDQLKVKNDKASGIISFEVANAHIKEDIDWTNFNGSYIQQVALNNTSTGVGGTIKINPGMEYDYKVETKDGQTYIRINKPPFENMNYTSGAQPVLELASVPGLNANAITVDDQYRNKKIVINLGGDFSQYFGNGTFSPADSAISSIQITNNGTTKLTVSEKNIYAVNVNDTGDKVQIQFVKPKQKYKNIVVLDPGHGGGAPGASASGLVEKTVNLKHAMAVYERLENDPNIKVYITRVSDADVPNQNRADLANNVEADIFISMHNNSIDKSTVNGTEVLHAAKYADARSTKSKQMADIVLRRIDTGTNIGIRRIIPRDDLLVLNQTKMPAILIETGYMTSSVDASLINSPQFIEQLGEAVYQGIVEIFNTMSFR